MTEEEESAKVKIEESEGVRKIHFIPPEPRKKKSETDVIEEATVKRSGKDLDVTFSSQEKAEEWRSRFASIMEQEGYHLTREKPKIQEDATSAG